MANLRDIRRRIRSVKNTAQITRAMQLVASSKMKRAQDQAVAARAYGDHLTALLRNLKNSTEEFTHPLVETREVKRELVIVVTTDKGLCGGLNTNLLRRVLRECPPDAEYTTVGNKGRNAMAKLKRDLVADFTVRDPVHFNEVRRVARFATDRFLDGMVDRVTVAFTNFVNTLTQTPHLATLLPLDPSKLAERADYEENFNAGTDAANAARFADYLVEPGRVEVFGTLLPLYVNFRLYQMVMEARASEHSARMVAMKSATDNAKSLVKELTLEYNKLRQAAITNEILEISTAQMALG